MAGTVCSPSSPTAAVGQPRRSPRRTAVGLGLELTVAAINGPSHAAACGSLKYRDWTYAGLSCRIACPLTFSPDTRDRLKEIHESFRLWCAARRDASSGRSAVPARAFYI